MDGSPIADGDNSTILKGRMKKNDERPSKRDFSRA
jgi:hypothetical protein